MRQHIVYIAEAKPIILRLIVVKNVVIAIDLDLTMRTTNEPR